MTFPVKWFSSAMEGAPLLSSGVAGAAHTTSPGSLIALLKAVLVTGFGIKSVSSLVYSSAAQTITATVAAGHKYLVDQVIALSGANESGFNGEFRVLSVTSTTVVVRLDNGTPSAASATGTLSMNIPSLGWAIEFEDAANYKIIFKRSDPLSTPIRLYIDNSAWSGWNNYGGPLAKVQMIENPTDINTFSTVYEHRWPCSHNYGNTEWQFIGDARLFFFIPTFSSISRRSPYAFGDIISIRPGDNYHCMMTLHSEYPTSGVINANNWSSSLFYERYNNFPSFSDANHKRLARSHHQLPGSVAMQWKNWPSAMGEGMSFPNPADNGFYVTKDLLPIFDDLSFRGYLPGVISPFATSVAYDATNLKNLPNIPNKIVRMLMISKSSYAGSYSIDPGNRLVGFDLTGPWR